MVEYIGRRIGTMQETKEARGIHAREKNVP